MKPSSKHSKFNIPEQIEIYFQNRRFLIWLIMLVLAAGIFFTYYYMQHTKTLLGYQKQKLDQMQQQQELLNERLELLSEEVKQVGSN